MLRGVLKYLILKSICRQALSFTTITILKDKTNCDICEYYLTILVEDNNLTDIFDH